MTDDQPPTGVENADDKAQPNIEELKASAQAYHELGIPVVPCKIWLGENGLYEKKNIGYWKKWETQPQTQEEFSGLEWKEANGFAVILGTKAKNGLYLSVVDYDVKGKTVSEEAKAKGKEILKSFPITQTDETVNKGTHYVYWSRCKVETDGTFHDTAAIELLGEKKLCVMPPSYGYRKINDNSPTEIENLEENFYSILKQNGFAVSEEIEVQNQLDNYSFQISKLVDLTKFNQISPNEYQGSHPVHDSTTEKNFCVNIKTNQWHCFRHNSGGGALQFLAVKEGLIKCEQAKKGALRGKKFREVLQVAVSQELIDEKALVQSEINPIILAKDIIEEFPFATEKDTNELFFYDEKEGVYTNNTEQLIKREIARRLDENFKARYYTEISEFITATAPLVEMDKQNPEILAVRNGLLNIDTRELKPFSSTTYITHKLSDVEYNPTAQATVFLTFLYEVVPNPTQRLQIQELIGHCLIRKILTEICLI